MRKRFLSMLLTATMLLTLLPQGAWADSDPSVPPFDVSEGNITISAGNDGTLNVKSGASQTDTIISISDEITITGTTTASYVLVQPGVAADITLENVDINVSSQKNACAFDMAGATVNLNLVGENMLHSSILKAGLRCPSGSTLTIDGSGTITAICGNSEFGYCAGIGGNGDNGGTLSEAGGSVTINGGTVTAESNGGAAIGGGCSDIGDDGGIVSITGGSVMAKSICGAGIGGGSGRGESGDGGTVSITGGTVTAQSSFGAGIGGGGGGTKSGDGGIVSITGGTVTATSFKGAGIGGGLGGDGIENMGGSGGAVYISGGSVFAVPGKGSEAIGKTWDGISSGTLQNNATDEKPVYLTTVTLSGVDVKTAVSSLTAHLSNAPYSYDTQDMYTSDTGMLYLYLPENTETSAAQISSTRYTGSVITTANSSAQGTLSADTAAPTVTAVTPSGTGASTSGNLAITFSEEMRSGEGTVSLSADGTNYTPLAAGSWSATTPSYTVSYSGLNYSKPYTVKMEGFKDYNGNTMETDITHSFITAANSSAVSSGGGGGGSGGGGSRTTTGHSQQSLSADGTLKLTASELSDMKSLTVSGDGVKLLLSEEMLKKLNVKERLEIGIVPVKKETLSPESRQIVGNRPVFDISIIVDGKRITDTGKIEIELPYTPKEGEDASKLAVYYISADGKLEKMAGGHYDPVKKAMIFTTDHLSVYAIGLEAVAPAPISITGPSLRFTDVPSGYWAEEAINRLTEKSILKGKAEGIFAPSDRITRAEIVTLLAKLNGQEPSKIASGFTDVPAGEWHAPYVAWAAENGIVKGYGSTFNPDAPITRQDMAAMLTNYMEKAVKKPLPQTVEAKAFADEIAIADYAKAAVKAMQQAGIISGKEDNRFDPTGSATRAEAAKMAAGLMKMME